MEKNQDFQLCKDLKPIYELELSSGNTVERVEKFAYTKCDLGIYFSKPLHFKEIEKGITLSSAIERWENNDRHYSMGGEAGYYCSECKHSVAGPLKK